MNLPRVEACFKKLRLEASQMFPELEEVDLLLDPSVGDSPRSFAACQIDNRGNVSILVAGKLELAPAHRVEGIIRHEFGHAVDFLYDLDELFHPSAERRADEVAELIWGSPIYYEAPLWIQSISRGVSPRPSQLPR
jgi:hypothetical protein